MECVFALINVKSAANHIPGILRWLSAFSVLIYTGPNLEPWLMMVELSVKIGAGKNSRTIGTRQIMFQFHKDVWISSLNNMDSAMKLICLCRRSGELRDRYYLCRQ